MPSVARLQLMYNYYYFFLCSTAMSPLYGSVNTAFCLSKHPGCRRESKRAVDLLADASCLV